jgi:hypothetical protein
MTRIRAALAVVAVAAVGLLSLPARADFNPISQPDAAYVSSTTVLPVADPDLTVLAALSDGAQTATFTGSVETRTVPSTWGTWGSPPDTESNTPRVLFTQNASTLTIDLSLPSAILGFEAEPDDFGTHSINADFFAGGILIGSISRSVAGASGARLFAASSSTDSFDRVVITADTAGLGFPGFGIAQIRYAGGTPPPPNVPEPGTLALVACGSAPMLALLRRRR